MIKIYAEHRKPVDTEFHKKCKNKVKNEFYHYMPKRTAREYVNSAHNISVRIYDINEDMRGIFCKYLIHIGEEITDKSLYLLSLLQKVGEDKIRESLQYNNALCSRFQEMTVGHLEDNYKNVYNNSITQNMFREYLGLSIFIAQAIIFAFNAFKSIWEGVKDK